VKVLVKSAVRMSGIGKESKAPYDFCQLEVMVPAENIDRPNTKRVAYGVQDMKPLNLDPSLLPFFAKITHQLPMLLDVTIEQQPNRGQLENIVVGVKHIPAVQAA
jgi:hypothetical protein